MFVVKFQQVQEGSAKFSADKNDNMPFIGEVLAGKAKGTLINGTIFQREGYSTSKMYACQNVVEEYEGKPQVRVQILSEVSVLEYAELLKVLGKGQLLADKSSESVPSDEEVSFEE